MAKARKSSSEDRLVQIVFRATAAQHEALQEATRLLGVDLSNLLRMMISEHVGEFIARGKKGEESLAQARKTTGKKPSRTPSEPNERFLDV